MPTGMQPIFNQTFNAHIGPIFGSFEGPDLGPHDFLFDVKDHHLNSDGFAHGGLLMALADIMLGSTVAYAKKGMGATISLNCDFLAAVPAGTRLKGETRINRMTPSVAFVSGRLFSGDRTFLTALGVWKVANLPEGVERKGPLDFPFKAPVWEAPEPPAGHISLELHDPFEAHLGPFFTPPDFGASLSDRTAQVCLDERHMNSREVCHGGALMTFADAFLGGVAHRAAGTPVVTLSVQSNFLRPGKIGDWVTIRPRVTRTTRSIVFAEVDLLVEEEPIFTATSLWKVLGK